ncbi:ComF family protein [Eubacterium ventriosum]|uniref:ComF family protein n=1 Tax=Eubacterium ventriosum TaxID=39496 RepID=UPI00399C4565
MLGRVIEWMYPTVCPVCQKVLGKGKIICDTCKDELHIINEPRCAKCGKPLTDSGKTYCNDCKKMKHYYDRARSVFEYTGEMKLVLYRFKYGNSRDYGKVFAKVAKDVLENKLKEWNVQAIIPVPMYKDKEIKRGYNQAEVFGRALSKETGIALDDKCIIRKKSTVPQKKLSNEMRKINLQKAFGVDRKICSEYKTVLLVDDIYTTGSTFDACAKVLKVAGVEKVYCLSVAVGRDG